MPEDKVVVQGGDALLVPLTPKVEEKPIETPKTETKPDQEVASIKSQLEALTKQLAQMKVESTRAIQSAKDKALSEVKRAKLSEDVLTQIKTRVQSVSPELAKDVELETLRAKAKGLESLSQEEEVKNSQEEFHKQFRANIEESLADLGLDVKTAQIDWADDAPNYIEAQKRILKSAAKIKKEQETASRGELQKQLEKQLKEAEVKLRKELGLDSVDTTPGGVGNSDDISFINKVASGVALTPDERKRAKKLLST